MCILGFLNRFSDTAVYFLCNVSSDITGKFGFDGGQGIDFDFHIEILMVPVEVDHLHLSYV